MTTTSGYLILADISGFAAYLADVELAHAEQIVTELYATLRQHLQPYVADALVEGGALLGHIPAPQAPPATGLLDLIETSYAAFRQHLLTLRHNITCQCRACQNVSQLDLKFLVHYGQYLRHQLGGQVDLMGLDVTLIRSRVLKAPVAATTQWAALALFTAPALEQLRLTPTFLPLHPQTITVAPHGEVQTYSLDLQAQYAARRAAQPILITSEQADLDLQIELPAPPAVVWEWLNAPEKRSLWTAGRRWSARLRPQGRLTTGASNHCDHGVGHVMEVILDWQPYTYMTSEYTMHPGGMQARQTFALELRPHGHTRLAWRFRFGLPRPLVRLGRHLTQGMFQQDLQRLQQLVAKQGQETLTLAEKVV